MNPGVRRIWIGFFVGDLLFVVGLVLLFVLDDWRLPVVMMCGGGFLMAYGLKLLLWARRTLAQK